AAAMHPYHTLSGFLPTGTCCTFGAAAAGAKLMGLDETGMINALGNAGYLAPLSMAEQLMGGYTIKIVQGGQAASAGIMAAGLASRGVTGHPQVLEGSELKGGFTQITVKAEPVFDRITDRLGEHLTIMDVYFKPYTACRHTHGAAQAALELLKERPIKTGDIDAVTVYSYGIALIAVGKGVTKESSFVTAQFSIPHVTAACLLDGDLGPKQLTEKRIADPMLLDLAGKVTVVMDDELNKVYPEKTSSRVEIVMKNGEKLIKQVDIPKGDPRDPMGADDLAAKVHRFAGNRDGKKVDRVIDMVLGLEKLENIKELVALI
ncbi:MAG TPA: MmgE/PrpD family protein, partial [Spirochaetes bacterium]|nr:MmgE/PrpD family protein [Spirochaetota bacterium]